MTTSYWRHRKTDWIVTVDGTIDPRSEKVSFFPRDGGFGKSTDPQRFLSDFELLTDDDIILIDSDYKPFKFGFDCEGEGPNEVYTGWTNGRTWNGWASPLVEKAVLLEWIGNTQLCGEMTLAFDESENQLWIEWISTPNGESLEDDSTCVVDCEWINTPNGETMVWDISLGLCWINWDNETEDA